MVSQTPWIQERVMLQRSFGPSQWEATLHCSVVSHWLRPYTKCSPCLGYRPQILRLASSCVSQITFISHAPEFVCHDEHMREGISSLSMCPVWDEIKCRTFICLLLTLCASHFLCLSSFLYLCTFIIYTFICGFITVITSWRVFHITGPLCRESARHRQMRWCFWTSRWTNGFIVDYLRCLPFMLCYSNYSNPFPLSNTSLNRIIYCSFYHLSRDNFLASHNNLFSSQASRPWLPISYMHSMRQITPFNLWLTV